MTTERTIWVVYGPAGCGKSSLCSALAQATSGVYVEGDEYHSTQNVEKMRSGIALEDEDRREWLQSLVETSAAQASRSPGNTKVFVSCSALKTIYRDTLRNINDTPGLVVRFIYLKLNYEEARVRAASRLNHYMADSMVKGQYDILEEPQERELDVTIADATLSTGDLVTWALKLVNDREPLRKP